MVCNWIRNCLLVILVLWGHGSALTAPLTLGDVPEPLKSWVPWALDEETKHACPFLFDRMEVHHCAWPGALELQANSAGASFAQDWRVYRETWIPLPGDERQWPDDVKLDGKPAVVLSHGGVPALKVGAGVHQVTGRLRWAALPESLAIPASIGIVRLTLAGKSVAQPVRGDDNRLWLGRKADSTAVEQTQIQVHRKVIDGVPIKVETRIRISVSGRGREISIGRILLPELIATELVSPLPAALAHDGSLKVQARAGHWDLVLMARHPMPSKSLALPASTGLVAEEEVWVFEGAPLLRSASVEGPPAVDPQQTTLPNEWHRLPAYLMRPGAVFVLKEVRRGDSEPAPHKLSLVRRLWLSFDGREMTLQDRIRGHISMATRLEMGGPAQLGRVEVAGHDQLITKGSGGLSGVEVRRGDLALTADSLVPGAEHSFSAVGWKQDFDKVSLELALPPGWRLLYAAGADRADGSWLSLWNLLDLFLVLVIALAIGRLWGRSWGVVAFLLLALSYHEAYAPRYAWLVLLAAVALARAVPAGRFKTLMTWVERAALVSLVLLSLAFATSQVRGALYPVLELDGRLATSAVRSVHVAAEMPAAPAVEEMVAEDAAADQQMTAESEAKDGPDRAPRLRGALNALKKESSRNYSQQSYQSIDPSANVQTGPGLPDWHWREYSLSWDGPVLQGQQLSLWLLPPWAHKGLVVLRLLLLALVLACIAGVSLRRWRSVGGGGGLAAAALAVACGVLSPGQVQAQLPDEKMLNQLKEKLTRPADCLPQCADISLLSVHAAGSALRLGLDLHAAVDTALPLPGGAKYWTAREARLDGKAAFVHRDEGGALWLLVPAGLHRVELNGDLPLSDTVQLPLPRKPRRVEVSATDWEVSGLSDETGAADTFQLTRRQKAGSKDAAPVLPPFLRVERRLILDLVWRVETTVRRESPMGVPALVEVPLLSGEAVVTSGINVKDGRVLVNLGAQADAISWSSTLNQSGLIALTAAKDTAWAETWALAASTMWHVEPDGIPPVAAGGVQGGDLVFRPWPGETLKLKVERPPAVAGQTLTVDSSRLSIKPGTRATDYQLGLVLRSSRGHDYRFTLPEGASLQSVSINREVRAIRASGRELVVPILPGKQNVELVWRLDKGMSLSYRSVPVDLRISSVNSNTELHLPRDRWLLLTAGPGIGPAILFWGVLLVMLVVAVALGRFREFPIKTRHWVLLALGLTQVPWWAVALVVGWFFAFLGRGKDKAIEAVPWQFNAYQLILVALTGAMFATLVMAMIGGLLGQPEMQVTGNGSTSGLLRWYVDRADPQLESPWILTVPMLAYRGLMLAWALWLAWSLLAWISWAWESFGRGGWWRKETLLAKDAASTGLGAQVDPRKS